MKLSENLEQLMRLHGNLTVSDLARLSHIPQPTLHHILSGATKRPRKNLIHKLADYFSITSNQLLGKEPLPLIIPDFIQKDLNLRPIPIIEWDMLKEWPNNRTVKSQYDTLILKDEDAGNAFALCIQDSSMEPMFPQGSFLIFLAHKVPRDRDFVISYFSKTNEIAFNRIFLENQEKFIKESLPDGNASLIKLDENNDRIIGTLIEVRIQF